MRGLENILKRVVGDDMNETCKNQSVKGLSEAMDQVSSFIDANLPKVLEIDIIPLCFDLTFNEKNIVFGGKQGNIASYDLVDKKMLLDIELCSCSIKTIHFALEDRLVVATNQAWSMYIIDYPSLITLSSLPLGVNKLDVKIGFSNDCIIVTNLTNQAKIYNFKCYKENNILYKDMKTEIEIRSLDFSSQALCVDVSEDGTLIGFGFVNGIISLYHGESESELQSSCSFNCPIEKLTFSQSKKFIAFVLNKAKAVVLTIDSVLSTKLISKFHKASINSLCFIKDDRYLITGGDDALIIMYDLKVERTPYFLELFKYSVLWVKPSKDHKKLYYSQDTNKFMTWEAPLLEKSARYRKHTKPVRAVVFIPKSYEMLSCGEDGLAVLWDCRTNTIQVSKNMIFPLTLALASKTGKFVIIGSEKSSIIRWNICTYKKYETEFNEKIKCMRFSNDEKYLAIGDDMFRIIVVNLVDMSRKVVIKGHGDEVTELCFLINNGMLSSSRDSTVIHWNLGKIEKIRAFQGHTKAVLCMLVSDDEKTLITGSEDLRVNIWTLDGILVYTLNLQHPVKKLYLTTDFRYLVTIDPWQMSFWQLDNLSLAYRQDLNSPQCVTFANDDQNIAIAQGNTIFVEENPLKTTNLRVVGKNKSSAHKFMSYVQEIFNDNIRTEYFDTYNQWIFTPYIISIFHILAYKNKYDILHKALIETQNRVPFSYTIKNECPLSISVFLSYKCCIETCLKYMKKEFCNKNPYAYVPLGKCLTKLNALDVNSIPKVYEMIFTKDKSLHLPSYCSYGTKLPYVYYSDNHMIDVRKILSNEQISTHGQSVVFNKSLCPLDIEIGTLSSIDFLKSLLESSYPEIFRAKIVSVLLRDKWEKIRFFIYIRGFLYIFYLVQLSVFCIFFIDSLRFIYSLFVTNGLMMLYEILQILTDKYEYWKDLWNILDQLRGGFFILYGIMFLYGSNKRYVLLIVFVFSWTRGISYFRMFEGTRYMVRLLSEVIKDMQIFLVLLFYSTLAFAFILFINNPIYTFAEYTTISYKLDLGDFGSDYHGAFGWTIFFLATVINPLIMLNMLISIMCDTYDKVQTNNDIANYQELTEMIIEIEKIMFWKRGVIGQVYIHQCEYLKGNDQNSDKTLQKIKKIKKQMRRIQKELSFCYEEIKKNNELTHKALLQSQQVFGVFIKPFYKTG
ncbi:hypothetical protein SteCoe_33401 [Stentor coeruleus]|uniref:Uncharacterized protein n=1 Tax=Stentor coeruleus TaxID=5963 RepID=A0A1R2AWS8_9CILI|nr:hypothetical protein SteCoe_33401 [Stentor coeruleus]